MRQKSDEEILIEYIRCVLFEPENAKLDESTLSKEKEDLAKALRFLGDCVINASEFAKTMANGNLDCENVNPRNVLLAPLKTLQSNLRHLTWVAECVASGDYSKRVTYMGNFAVAFNKMIEQLGESNGQLQRITCTDALTGVGNRYYFKRRARELSEKGKEYCLAFIDIDSLKRCNDKYGHAQGDVYIRSICEYLHAMCKEGEEIFRTGGDEFLMISETASLEQLEARLEEVREAYMKVYEVSDEDVRSFSYGCQMVYPSDDHSASEYLSKADWKMYLYKSKQYEKRRLKDARAVRKKELDTSGLDSRIFEVFSHDMPNRYLFICNLDTKVSRWSKQAVEDFGLSGEYMYDVGNVLKPYIHPEDREVFMTEMEAIFEHKRLSHSLEYRVRNKAGEYILCSSKGHVLQGEGGAPSIFAGTITNCGVVEHRDLDRNYGNSLA